MISQDLVQSPQDACHGASTNPKVCVESHCQFCCHSVGNPSLLVLHESGLPSTLSRACRTLPVRVDTSIMASVPLHHPVLGALTCPRSQHRFPANSLTSTWPCASVSTLTLLIFAGSQCCLLPRDRSCCSEVPRKGATVHGSPQPPRRCSLPRRRT